MLLKIILVIKRLYVINSDTVLRFDRTKYDKYLTLDVYFKFHVPLAAWWCSFLFPFMLFVTPLGLIMLITQKSTHYQLDWVREKFYHKLTFALDGKRQSRLLHQGKHFTLSHQTSTAWKVSVFGVFLVRIF